MSGPVTAAADLVLVWNADGLRVCAGCGAPVVQFRGGQIKAVHHVSPCPEAERVIGNV